MAESLQTGLTMSIQIVGVAGYTAIVAIAVYLWRRWVVARALVVVPALWAAYGAIYYVLVLAGRLAGDALLLWGAIHRSIAMLMVLVGLIVLWLVMTAPPPEYHDDDGGPDGWE